MVLGAGPWPEHGLAKVRATMVVWTFGSDESIVLLLYSITDLDIPSPSTLGLVRAKTRCQSFQTIALLSS